MSIRRRGGGRQDSNIRYCSGSESRCECSGRSHVKKLEGGMTGQETTEMSTWADAAEGLVTYLYASNVLCLVCCVSFFKFGSTFRFPYIPLPLFQMCQSVDAKKSDGTVKLVTVVGVKVDANATVELAQRRWWAE